VAPRHAAWHGTLSAGGPQHALQARLLYHEAACSDDVAGERGLGQRLALLREALSAAAAATDAAPASLSCAALRATLVVNLLVENGRGQVGSDTLNAQPPYPLVAASKSRVEAEIQAMSGYAWVLWPTAQLADASYLGPTNQSLVHTDWRLHRGGGSGDAHAAARGHRGGGDGAAAAAAAQNPGLRAAHRHLQRWPPDRRPLLPGATLAPDETVFPGSPQSNAAP
jgi:hypothetical protein